MACRPAGFVDKRREHPVTVSGEEQFGRPAKRVAAIIRPGNRSQILYDIYCLMLLMPPLLTVLRCLRSFGPIPFPHRPLCHSIPSAA